ncbi:MAG: mechanosensitive ion channel [Betaproteobacteria bacterium]|nr:mechanosensitive ion channel [Betaproteobacteria bacterium]
MDFSTMLSSLQSTLGTHLPMILGALGILVVGWIVAVVLRGATRRLLGAIGLNDKLEGVLGQKLDIANGTAIGVFWLIIVITLVAVFNSLDLESVSGPFAQLVSQVLGYIPHLVAGGVLLLVAWVLATAARALVTKVMSKTSLDEKLSAQAGMAPMSSSVGDILFWLVILLFLPMVLAAFQLQGLLSPIQNMLDELLGMLPNVFAALVIGFVGYIVAKVLRGLVANLAAATGMDRFGGTVNLSGLLGTVVFIFVFVPALIAALDALKIETISKPATEMLSRFMGAIPDIFAAAIILAVTYAVASFVSGFLSRLLAGLGFDGLPARLGFGGFQGELQPSGIVGKLVLFFAMLFGTVEAANRLGFSQVRDVVTMFIQFGGDILLGSVILLVGFWLANLAYNTIVKAGGEQAGMGARIARVAILGLVMAMGLRAMGIADDIVNLAFGLTLGAVAVAVALAFGLGGREAAGKQMEHWLSKMRRD